MATIEQRLSSLEVEVRRLQEMMTGAAAAVIARSPNPAGSVDLAPSGEEPRTGPVILSVREASDLLNCSTGHVYDMIAERKLRTVPHMGRRRLIPLKAIEELIASAMTGEVP